MKKISTIIFCSFFTLFLLFPSTSFAWKYCQEGEEPGKDDCVPLPEPSPSSSSTTTTTSVKSRCEKFTDWLSKNPGADASIRGLVCTDLMEGIPANTIGDKSACIADDGTPRPAILTTFADGEICYALATPTGIGAITVYIGMIYKYASWAIGILAVLMLIVEGLKISIGRGAPEVAATAKKRIAQILSGVALFFLIGVILHTVNPLFFS